MHYIMLTTHVLLPPTTIMPLETKSLELHILNFMAASLTDFPTKTLTETFKRSSSMAMTSTMLLEHSKQLMVTISTTNWSLRSTIGNNRGISRIFHDLDLPKPTELAVRHATFKAVLIS